jgi:hypothetical protein
MQETSAPVDFRRHDRRECRPRTRRLEETTPSSLTGDGLRPASCGLLLELLQLRGMFGIRLLRKKLP